MTVTAGVMERRGGGMEGAREWRREERSGQGNGGGARRGAGGGPEGDARRGGGGGLETRDQEETQTVSATAYLALAVYQTVCMTCVTSHSSNSARQVF